MDGNAARLQAPDSAAGRVARRGALPAVRSLWNSVGDGSDRQCLLGRLLCQSLACPECARRCFFYDQGEGQGEEAGGHVSALCLWILCEAGAVRKGVLEFLPRNC